MNDPMGDAPQIQRAPARKAPAKKAQRKPQKRPPLVPQQAKRQVYEDPDDGAHAAAPVARNNPRPPTREANREAARASDRAGGVVVVGRDGEQLTRRHTSVGDKFHIEPSEVPHGWDYQWNSVTVHNKGMDEIIRGDLGMHRNGWRPVPSSRFPGRWTPEGFEGQIVIDGLRLEERPMSLSVEAKQEDTARAKALVRDRTDALRMTQKQLPGADVARARNNAGRMNMSIDPGLDIPLPQHELEE